MVHVLLIVVVVVATIGLRLGIRLYELKKQREGTAGFWTRPMTGRSLTVVFAACVVTLVVLRH